MHSNFSLWKEHVEKVVHPPNPSPKAYEHTLRFWLMSMCRPYRLSRPGKLALNLSSHCFDGVKSVVSEKRPEETEG